MSGFDRYVQRRIAARRGCLGPGTWRLTKSKRRSTARRRRARTRSTQRPVRNFLDELIATVPFLQLPRSSR